MDRHHLDQMFNEMINDMKYIRRSTFTLKLK